MIIPNSYHETYNLPAWELIADELAEENDGSALRTLFQCSRFFNNQIKSHVLHQHRGVLISKILRHTKGAIPQQWNPHEKQWQQLELFSDETFRNSVYRLNLSRMPKLTNKQFRVLSCLFPQLTILVLKECEKLKDASFTKPKSAIEAPSHGLPKRLSNLRISKSSKKNLEALSTLIGERWKNLRVLDVSYCKHISDLSMAAIAKGMKKAIAEGKKGLKVLNLNGCELLTPGSITAICQRSPKLTKLGIAATGVTGEAVEKIVTLCPKIVQCNLSCLPVNDADLTIIAKKLPALQGIGLDFCPSITQAGVTALFEGCTKLKTVTLVGCYQFKPKEIHALAKGYPHIRHIECWNKARTEQKSDPEVVDVLDSTPLRIRNWRGQWLIQSMENSQIKL